MMSRPPQTFTGTLMFKENILITNQMYLLTTWYNIRENNFLQVPVEKVQSATGDVAAYP